MDSSGGAAAANTARKARRLRENRILDVGRLEEEKSEGFQRYTVDKVNQSRAMIDIADSFGLIAFRRAQSA